VTASAIVKIGDFVNNLGALLSDVQSNAPLLDKPNKTPQEWQALVDTFISGAALTTTVANAVASNPATTTAALVANAAIFSSGLARVTDAGVTRNSDQMATAVLDIIIGTAGMGAALIKPLEKPAVLITAAALIAKTKIQQNPGVIGPAIGEIGPQFTGYMDEISRGLNDLMTRAMNWSGSKDPLAVDLDGDGIDATAIAASDPVLFDHDADNIKTATGWIAPDDGLVVLDRNGNGTIDTGRELFGDNTLLANGELAAHGFEAIAELDGNADGRIDAQDAAYTQLRIWRDLNQDGISQSGELSTLADTGIASIGVVGTATSIDLGNGNTQPWSGSFTRTDGTTGVSGTPELSGSLLLASNGFFREFTDDPSVTASAADLPQMRASGWVRDLREAMSLGSADAQALEVLVGQFAVATSRDAQQALLGDLISAWAKTSGKLTSHGIYLLAEGNFRTASDGTAESAAFADRLTINVAGMAFESPERQAFLKQLWALEAFNGSRFIQIALPEQTGGNFPAALASGGGGGGGGSGGVALPYNFYQLTLSAQQVSLLQDAWGELAESIYSALVAQTRLAPYLDSVEVVINEEGISFDTTAMNAMLDARRVGDERSGLIDLIELNRYLQPTLAGIGFDGMGKLRGWIDGLAVDSPLRAELPALGVYQGAATAGTTKADLYFGDAANNTFHGGGSDDVLRGEEGGDQLHGGAGDDMLDGGADSDVLHGGEGDDVLDGGAGNDTLAGGIHDTWNGAYWGWGADTYRFGRGDGQDFVREYDTTAGVVDRIVFKAGVLPADVQVVRPAGTNELVLKIAGTADQITLSNYFSNDGVSGWSIEEILFEDDSYVAWTVEDIKQMAIAGTPGADNLVGYASADAIDGGEGNDTVIGGAGNDTLRGQAGADGLHGGDGDDALEGGSEADVLQGGQGDDLIDGGAGNDILAGGIYDTWNGYYWGWGADTYLFGRGDGQDFVRDNDTTAGVVDKIIFKPGVLPADVRVLRDGDNLVLAILGTGDQLTVAGYFQSDATSGWAIEEIRFADDEQAVWTVEAVKLLAIAGTSGADHLVGYASDDLIAAGDGNDTARGGLGNDTLHGGAGADNLLGDDGNDVLEGGADADLLQGQGGDDVLDGGAGNDILAGGIYDTWNGEYWGWGADTYLFGRGDGQDFVRENDTTAGVVDKIVFKAGVLPADVQVVRGGSNELVLKIAGTSDQITVAGYFTNDGTSGWVIEEIRFSDAPATVWSVADVKNMAALLGTEGNDTLVGYATADEMDGGGGNDVMIGGAGDDTLHGAAGGDTLWGEDGNDLLDGGADADLLQGQGGDDVLDGGAGNDILAGGIYDTWNGVYWGWGSDTYLFGRGDGQDLIRDNDTTAGVVDKIVFKAGVLPADVQVVRGGSNELVLKIAGTSDQITVAGYFTSDGTSGWVIEEIRFSDAPATVWSVANVKNMAALNGTAGNDTLVGYATADAMNGDSGNDAMFGGAGNDTLRGEAGSDSLYGQADHDVLEGGADGDLLQGDVGDDVLDGGPGNDILAGGIYDTWNGVYWGWGSDTYLFGRGDGQDLIRDNDGTAGAVDRILFKPGVLPLDVQVVRPGGTNDLVLRIAGTADQITVSNYFAGDGATSWLVEEVRFSDDPVVWSLADVKLMALTGTAGADVLQGYATDDVLQGGAGNDNMSGGAGHDLLAGGPGGDALAGQDGNDTLQGGDDADLLQGHAGDDVLDGGAGNDVLAGGIYDTWNGAYWGWGADTYLFGRGDGQDFIREYDATAGVVDRIRFKTGVAPADVRVVRSGDNLVLGIAGTSDQLTVAGYFQNGGNTPYLIELVEFENGVSWNFAAVQQILLSGGVGSNLVVGTAGADVLTGPAAGGVLQGLGGDDTYNVGAGHTIVENPSEGTDTVVSSVSRTLEANVENLTLAGSDAIDAMGNAGNNVLTGNAAANVLDGGAGDDTMAGGAGDDTYAVDSNGDVVTEAAGEGTDLVNAAVTWTLAATVENLTLTGSGAINGTGNTGDNVLRGNAAANVLTGLGGNDTYHVGAGDTVVEASSGGTDTVVSDVSWTLATHLENLTLVGDGAIDGTGNTANNVLRGNSGLNVLTGLAGNDTYHVGAGDTVVEAAGGGTDTIVSELTWSLEGTPDVEHLTLAGSGSIDATGNALGNALTGNAAANVLDGAAGNDTMRGGLGDDTYIVESSGDQALESANQGTDEVQASVTYTLSTNVENLTLVGTADIHATGNTGHNVLRGNAGANTLTGLAGNDTYYVGAGDTVVEAIGGGTDTVIAEITWALENNVEKLTLSGTQAIDGTGNALANTLTGNTAANVLDGGAGNDTMIGGAGDDTYMVDSTGDVVTEVAGQGTDLVNSSVTWTLASTLENLTLTGSDNINGTGNAQANVLRGNSGANVLSGASGDDTYYVGAGDTVTEASSAGGTDLVISDASWTLSNNVENLTLAGSADIDGTGNSLANILRGNSGVNVLTGGLGNDTYHVGAGDTVVEAAGGGIDTIVTSLDWTLSANVENLTLEGSADIDGTGNAEANVLRGNEGANTLSGLAGNDTYHVGAGDTVVESAGGGIDTIVTDQSWTLGSEVENLTLTGSDDVDATGNGLNNVLRGNGGINTLTGLGGNDTYYVGAGDTVVEASGAGTDTIVTDQSWTLVANVENLTLEGSGNVDGTGNSANNTLRGNSGANTLIGLGGSDTYYVGAGDTVIEAANAGIDTIIAQISWSLANSANVEKLTLQGVQAIDGTGNELANTLTGNAAANVLDGGAGNDTMNGAAGDDTYVVDSAGDVVTEAAGGGTDTVRSAVAWTLGANLENLTLTGGSSVNAAGNDQGNVLQGNTGANVLTGLAGDDVLDGGAGADTLAGGDGSDLYRIGVGYGTEVIQEDSSIGEDTISFDGAQADQLWFSRSGDDLQVAVIGTSDGAVVSNWYGGTQHRIETFQVAGYQLGEYGEVQALVDAMAAFAPPAAGQTTLPANYAEQLAPVISASWTPT
jgi:Ca2+-binding RTX toxin-like protein